MLALTHFQKAFGMLKSKQEVTKVVSFNSFPGNFCRLLITFANGLLSQRGQNEIFTFSFLRIKFDISFTSSQETFDQLEIVFSEEAILFFSSEDSLNEI